MSPDNAHPAAAFRVVITDEMGRPLRKPSLARWIRSVAPARARGCVTVALVNDAAMRRLNREYADADHATDVLSFPDEGGRLPTPDHGLQARHIAPGLKPGSPTLPGTGGLQPGSSMSRGTAGLQTGGMAPHLGDIAIAMGVAGRQAREAGHSLETELRVLALHGLLHLLGYDHTVDGGAMAKLERRLRRKGGLSEGLIDRAGRTSKAGRADRADGASVGQRFSVAGRRGRAS